MKKWSNIELSDNVGGGATNEGQPFVETKIIAWNREDRADTEDLLVVTGTLTHKRDRIFVIEGQTNEWRKNDYLQLLVEEAVESLSEELRDYNDIVD